MGLRDGKARARLSAMGSRGYVEPAEPEPELDEFEPELEPDAGCTT